MRGILALSLGMLAVTLAGSAIAQDVDLPDGPGKQQIMTACTACHAITQVTSQKRSSASWADIVDQMISHGAQISDTEYPMVIEYLSRNFGTSGGASTPMLVPKH